MSINATNPPPAMLGALIFVFLFLTAMAACFLGAGLVLGTEPRLVLKRGETAAFQVTGSNHFAGLQFFSKTIEGVKGLAVDDSMTGKSRASQAKNRKRRVDLHLEFSGANNAQLNWGRESDAPLIEEFMRGKEPSLSLADKPPLWRMAAAWFLVGFGSLVFLGAIQSLFPKKEGGQ